MMKSYNHHTALVNHGGEIFLVRCYANEEGEQWFTASKGGKLIDYEAINDRGLIKALYGVTKCYCCDGRLTAKETS